MGLFSLFLASCPLIEGRQREWNGREALASLKWNFSAAEGPPAHNPQINSFQLSPSATTSINHLHKEWLIGWAVGLTASLLARWGGVSFTSFSNRQRQSTTSSTSLHSVDSVIDLACCFISFIPLTICYSATSSLRNQHSINPISFHSIELLSFMITR